MGPKSFVSDRCHTVFPSWSTAIKSPLSKSATTRFASTTGVGAAFEVWSLNACRVDESMRFVQRSAPVAISRERIASVVFCSPSADVTKIRPSHTTGLDCP
jgi:hypothetical protein